MRRFSPIEQVEVSAYTIPTDSPESDGTLEWDKTTIVIVEISSGNSRGMGYTYADRATAVYIKEKLASIVLGSDPLDIAGVWKKMVAAGRNLGRPGIVSMAISAVDIALWDLKAKLLDVPLVKLLGAVRESIPVYGSGGFTSYSTQQLQEQFSCWADQGISMFKMKIGREPVADPERVRAGREAIGPHRKLFVDANGAYSRKQALLMAEKFREFSVTWFEEPVSSGDLAGLRLIRDQGPPGMAIAAGEYGYDAHYFQRMLNAGAVDVLQADATRCAGITGFLNAAELCLAYSVPLSAHTAPSVHAHLCCATQQAVHLEYFHDHVRIEHMLFDGALNPVGGNLAPDHRKPGLGLGFRRKEAARFAVAL
jgi:L-alanine-DL-glutamate epimerase-like enolase superfamily enzyme